MGVDGSEIRRAPVDLENPLTIIYKFLCIPGGDRRISSINSYLSPTKKSFNPTKLNCQTETANFTFHPVGWEKNDDPKWRAIEEVYERHGGTQGCQVCNDTQIHDLLPRSQVVELFRKNSMSVDSHGTIFFVYLPISLMVDFYEINDGKCR